jgi:hypothetical protein
VDDLSSKGKIQTAVAQKGNLQVACRGLDRIRFKRCHKTPPVEEI